MQIDWFTDFSIAMTVCNSDGVIIQMNEKAIQTFEDSGGVSLIGRNVFDCHPEPSKIKLKSMFESGQKNVYTIEKNGIRKLIYQTPWFKDGVYSGFMELSMEIPLEMPHFVRKGKNE